MSPRASFGAVDGGPQLTVRLATLAEQSSIARGMAGVETTGPPGSSSPGETGLLRSVQARTATATPTAVAAPRGRYHRKGVFMLVPLRRKGARPRAAEA